MDDYFEVFDLPRKLQVDLDALQEMFYELSRRHHPDFHQMAGPVGQAVALQRSALVNRAYRALREPVSRLAHVIALEAGQGEAAAGQPQAPMDLLEEMLDVQEALEGAKASGLDGQATHQLLRARQGLIERQVAGEAAMTERFAEWDRAIDAGDDRTPLLQWFKQALATRAYLGTVIDDLSEALGEDQDNHVSHRRH
jgi:molecular chaperone HscB